MWARGCSVTTVATFPSPPPLLRSLSLRLTHWSAPWAPLTPSTHQTFSISGLMPFPSPCSVSNCPLALALAVPT